MILSLLYIKIYIIVATFEKDTKARKTANLFDLEKKKF